MEIKKQILLPKSSFALANDEDVFISFQLNRTVSEIKNEKIDNVFNITQQYDTERQASLKFCVFGLVESKFYDTNNFIIDVNDSDSLILNLPKISNDCITGKTISVKTFELTPNSRMSRNLYGKPKSAYSILFEINKNELDKLDSDIINSGGTPKTKFLEFKIIDNNKNLFFTQTVPYLFYDLDGNSVKFGSQTADVDEDGNIIEIDNDFPFLYDRHWIKQYFNIQAPSFVSFTNTTLDVPENIVGNIAQLEVGLDQPSPYGLEQAMVVVSADNTIRNPEIDFIFSSQTINWNVGEQFKKVNVFINDDKFVESAETVSFKIINFQNCVPKSETDIITTLKIIDDDKPTSIRFLTNSFVVKSNASALTISYVFDKPLDVDGQSIVLYYTPSTNAILGKDFVLDKNNPLATEMIIDFNKGDISGSTTISLIDNNVYDLDKIIEFGFKNFTQNIVLNNIGANVDLGQVCRVTIQESLVTDFSSFILKNDMNKKLGAVRANKNPTNAYFNGVYPSSYYWNIDADKGFAPVAGLYDITITNIGDRVVYGNKIIENNSVLTAITISAQQLTDIIIELPSNFSFDKVKRKYVKSKYHFNFSSREQFLVPQSQNQSYPYPKINFDVEKDAGPSGSRKYYLTTKLNNFILNYDTTLSACSIDIGVFNPAVFDRVPAAYTNNLVFIGFNPNNAFNTFEAATSIDSSIQTSFEDTLISVTCSQFLPFGFNPISNPPYNFNYIKLIFRNIYPQSHTPLINEYNYFKLDPTITNPSNRGFVNWSQALNSTKQSMILSILNNGEAAVKISGQTINPGEKLNIRGLNQDINTLSLILPTNESYIKSISGFTFANYILELENVSYYSNNGQISGTPISFRFDSTNSLLSGPLNSPPQYYVVTEYNNLYVPHQGTSSVDCDSVDFSSNGNLQLTNLAVRGVLLPNSKSAFRRGYFVDAHDDLIFTCNSTNSVRIPFKILP